MEEDNEMIVKTEELFYKKKMGGNLTKKLKKPQICNSQQGDLIQINKSNDVIV